MQNTLQAVITVLTLINPAICAATFLRIEAGRTFREKLVDASSAALAVVTILVIAALVGEQLLNMFGVSLNAFMVAGGTVLALIGFGMLRGSGNGAQTQTDGRDQGRPSLTPLVLFAASPGTITGVITLAIAHTPHRLPVTAIVAICVATAVMWLVIVLAARFGNQSQSKPSFVRDTITQFMGLIVIAMGVQFVLNGIAAFMKHT
jgi:multiple antibiotic resistance protein